MKSCTVSLGNALNALRAEGILLKDGLANVFPVRETRPAEVRALRNLKHTQQTGPRFAEISERVYPVISSLHPDTFLDIHVRINAVSLAYEAVETAKAACKSEADQCESRMVESLQPELGDVTLPTPKGRGTRGTLEMLFEGALRTFRADFVAAQERHLEAIQQRGELSANTGAPHHFAREMFPIVARVQAERMALAVELTAPAGAIVLSTLTRMAPGGWGVVTVIGEGFTQVWQVRPHFDRSHWGKLWQWQTRRLA